VYVRECQHAARGEVAGIEPLARGVAVLRFGVLRLGAHRLVAVQVVVVATAVVLSACAFLVLRRGVVHAR
jgi:predicted RNA methylase